MSEAVARKKISKAKFDDGYQYWPFKAVQISSDGDRNNGGIDLIAEPNRIDEIHEATKENGLRYLLEAINAESGKFMSLGCLSGTDDLYHSYVEFTPRDHGTAADESKIIAIHERWQDWLLLQDLEHPGLADAINARSAWEYREFSLRGNEPQFLIAVFHREHNEKTHAQLVEWFERFLREADHS